ncbi:thermitase isoform X2 [Folsomia candida]|nr:thermitase isoform X2 [Folsomia candida]
MQRVARRQVTEAIVEFPSIVEEVVANPRIKSLSGDDKAAAIVNSLKQLTAQSQKLIMERAKTLQLSTKSFWGSNIVLVQGLTETMLAVLGEVEGDFIIREQNVAHIHEDRITEGDEELVKLNQETQPQWGVAKIGAPAVWNTTQGEGIIIAYIDTGVYLGHDAIPGDTFAGAWFDPYYSYMVPDDSRGHGSHCAGIAIGRANGISVSPAAKWIACRGFSNLGSATESNLISCGQFILSATPRAHIVSNSWGGTAGVTWYDSIITAWRAAGMIPIFSVGDSGSTCRTVTYPGDSENVITIGASAATDAIAAFSSRGPTLTGNVKPDFVAPGHSIISCGPGPRDPSRYVNKEGSTAAAAHFTGAVALYLSQNRDATYEEIYEAFKATTVKSPLNNADRNCGLPPGEVEDYPNYAFGWGRIDVAAAMGV